MGQHGPSKHSNIETATQPGIHLTSCSVVGQDKGGLTAAYSILRGGIQRYYNRPEHLLGRPLDSGGGGGIAVVLSFDMGSGSSCC